MSVQSAKIVEYAHVIRILRHYLNTHIGIRALLHKCLLRYLCCLLDFLIKWCGRLLVKYDSVESILIVHWLSRYHYDRVPLHFGQVNTIISNHANFVMDAIIFYHSRVEIIKVVNCSFQSSVLIIQTQFRRFCNQFCSPENHSPSCPQGSFLSSVVKWVIHSVAVW